MKKKFLIICVFILMSTIFINNLKANLFQDNIACEDYNISALKVKNGKIKVDGVLNEKSWTRADSIDELIQCEPVFGDPASEKTIVKILYDEENIYLGAVCYYEDMDDLVATKLAHRDIGWEDQFAFVLDTFIDKIKAYCFMTNALGAKDEGYIDGSMNYNSNWNEVWTVKTRINNHNWTAEFKIPLRILRFSDKHNQMWGFNIYRTLRKKNERSYWTPIPPQHQITNLKLAGQIYGLEGLKMKRNLQFIPFVLLGGTKKKDITAADKVSEFGFDLKYVPMPNMAVDITYNTDFAQIKSDEEQINLSRFSLYYPEKRDFFLENAQLFRFGMPQKIQPFFSRRIGIHKGQSVPILYGARVTGKISGNNIGFLNMSTDEVSGLPMRNYTVLRYRRDILKNSNMGCILTNTRGKGNYNRCWGLDSEIWLTDNSVFRSFYSSVDATDIHSRNSASHLYYGFNRDLYQFTFGYTSVEENYDPATGFVMIKNIKDYSGILRKSFRPHTWGVRKIDIMGIYDYIYTQSNRDFMRKHFLMNTIEFDSGDELSFNLYNNYQKLYENFTIFSDIEIPAGQYNYNSFDLSFQSAPRRKLSGGLTLSVGKFYDGDRYGVNIDGTVKISRHLIVSSGMEYNQIHFPYGNLETTLGRLRLNFVFTSNISLKTYFQYNSAENRISSNIRFHMLHGNDNDLYLVYNNLTSTLNNRLISERNTAVFKMNYRVYL